VRRIRLILQYDGGAYAGWQVQPGRDTVQGRLEAVLARMAGGPVRVTGSGRTDAGVHALGQVAHFDTELEHADGVWVRALNAQLPRDLAVVAAGEVAEAFHARHTATAKHYRYRVLNRPVRCPFRRHHTWFVPVGLDVAPMARSARDLVGEHDFAAFRASGCGAKSPVRRLDRLEVRRVEDEVVFDLEGSGFLKQMARNLVGTLLEVGRGRRPADWPEAVLATRDRRAAGETAAAWGLTLVRVTYPPPFETERSRI
jgi:tRNA pseudouridine38-40 synthase